MKKKIIHNKSKLWLAAIGGFVIIVGLFLFLMQQKQQNYAAEAAEPIEASLVRHGGKKSCSRESSGRNTDNDNPRYYAIYEIPVGRSDAEKTMINIAKENGFNLAKDKGPQVENIPYSDEESVASSYNELRSGKVALFVDVFIDKVPSDKPDPFCTVKQATSSSESKTTIRFTVNLPAFK